MACAAEKHRILGWPLLHQQHEGWQRGHIEPAVVSAAFAARSVVDRLSAYKTQWEAVHVSTPATTIYEGTTTLMSQVLWFYVPHLWPRIGQFSSPFLFNSKETFFYWLVSMQLAQCIEFILYNFSTGWRSLCEPQWVAQASLQSLKKSSTHFQVQMGHTPP